MFIARWWCFFLGRHCIDFTFSSLLISTVNFGRQKLLSDFVMRFSIHLTRFYLILLIGLLDYSFSISCTCTFISPLFLKMSVATCPLCCHPCVHCYCSNLTFDKYPRASISLLLTGRFIILANKSCSQALLQGSVNIWQAFIVKLYY